MSKILSTCGTNLRHPVEHLLEPLIVNGQDLQVVELFVSHPVERLLSGDKLTVGGLGVADGRHGDRAEGR